MFEVLEVPIILFLMWVSVCIENETTAEQAMPFVKCIEGCAGFLMQVLSVLNYLQTFTFISSHREIGEYTACGDLSNCSLRCF